MKANINLLILFLVFPTCFLIAQHRVSRERVVYDFFHVRDSTQPSFIYQEEMELLFNTEGSLYTSLTKLKQDSANQRAFADAATKGSNEIKLGVLKAYNTQQIFVLNGQNGENRVYINEPFLGNNYLIEDKVEAINWQITTEVKSIMNHQCQKATGIFRGRKYTAWFSTDFPYAYGPWKLIGLPGLILQAMDDKNQVMFICRQVDAAPGDQDNISISIPLNSIKTTAVEFDRMLKVYKENQAAINSQEGNSFAVTVSKGNNNKRKIFNNPLELASLNNDKQ
jgi:GLPGLI family protein